VIPARAESLPASTPWSKAAANAGTARRWIALHTDGRIAFRAHDDERTSTVANIARMPSVRANGRYVDREGITRSNTSNPTERSMSSPRRWRARNRSPALATKPWNSVDDRFDTRDVTSEVVASRPHATARKSIR
jgi:hypothetical protein